VLCFCHHYCHLPLKVAVIRSEDHRYRNDWEEADAEKNPYPYSACRAVVVASYLPVLCRKVPGQVSGRDPEAVNRVSDVVLAVVEVSNLLSGLFGMYRPAAEYIGYT